MINRSSPALATSTTLGKDERSVNNYNRRSTSPV